MDAVLIWRIITSVKTALYLIAASMLVFLAGSMYIPAHLAVFSEINDYPLFRWLAANGEYFGITYWIVAQVGLMAALALNMAVCTIDGLRERIPLQYLVMRVSPHVVHMGVILVLFGHLVSGAFGYKRDIPVNAGESVSVEAMTINPRGVEFVERKGEDQKRWLVNISVTGTERGIEATIGPASPLFVEGLGIFAKSAEENGRVLLGVVRDPGVRWEIAGAIVFFLGVLGLFWSKYSSIQV